MPSKTHGDHIHDLWKEVNRLTERMDVVRTELLRIEGAHNKTAESLVALQSEFAVLKRDVEELRKASELGGQRWWSLVPAAVGAVMAAA